MKKFFEKHKFVLLLLIPLAVYFYFGVPGITQFETADEHYWYMNPIDGRIHEYWRAIFTGDLLKTRINDKPGITSAYVSGIGMFLEGNQQERILEENSFMRVVDPKKTEWLNLIFRLPQFIFNGLFIFFFFWVLKKLTENDWIALMASTLILLSPTLLGISQIVNPDSLLWVFNSASILCFLIYLKEEKRKFIFLTGLFLGLALLSKYAAIVLIPFYLAMIVFHFIFQYENWEKETLKGKALKYLGAFWLIVLEALVIFSVLMPAVFMDKSFLYAGTLGFRGAKPIFLIVSFIVFNLLILGDAFFLQCQGLNLILAKFSRYKKFIFKGLLIIFAMYFGTVFLNWSIGGNFLNIKSIPFDAGRTPKFTGAPLWDKIILEPRAAVFALLPLVFFALMFLWIKSIFKKTKYESIVFALTFFFLAFYLGVLTQDLLVHIRYSTVLYPLIMILAVIGIFEFFHWDKLKEIYRIGIFGLIIASSVISLLLIRPYYFNYLNNMLPKETNLAGGWGYGGYQAAQFLNKLPDAKNLTIWSDYRGVCSFFVGKCSNGVNIKKRKAGDSVDYLVITRRGSQQNKNLWDSIKHAGEIEKVWELFIDKRPRNFMIIYKYQENPKTIPEKNGGDENDEEEGKE